MLIVDIWLESFRCAGILLLQLQVENFAHREHLKFGHFQPVHSASKNSISPKVFNRFTKSWPQLEDVEGGHLGGSFRFAGILLLQWQGENFAHRQHLKFCHFQPVPFTSKILYLQRYLTDFRNLWLSSKMLKVEIWMKSLRCAGILVLQWQRENFAHLEDLKFCHFEPVPCASKNPISPKVFKRFSKSLSQLEDVDCGHLAGKFQVRWYFTFAMARWKRCASTTFEILPLLTCTLCQQKSYISKAIQPIFEIFACARRCWGWKFGWKV